MASETALQGIEATYSFKVARKEIEHADILTLPTGSPIVLVETDPTKMFLIREASIIFKLSAPYTNIDPDARYNRSDGAYLSVCPASKVNQNDYYNLNNLWTLRFC